MAEEISLVREGYGRNNYIKVIDTSFTQLIPPPAPVEQEPTIEDFFELYEELFFQIPINGETNSHEYIVKTSQEYIGDTVISDNEKALLEEINDLRRQLLELTKNSINE